MDGIVINDVDAGQRDIAMAFQTYALYPHMTVAENIGFPLRLAHVRVASVNRRVREVADLLQLADVLDRWPKQLSGGQQQRSALGRALVREPRLLLDGRTDVEPRHQAPRRDPLGDLADPAPARA